MKSHKINPPKKKKKSKIVNKVFSNCPQNVALGQKRNLAI